MKIDNYAVAMNAQYFDYKANSTEAKVSTNKQEFSNDNTNEVAKLQVDNTKTLRANNTLKSDLSSAVLKNLYGQSQKVRGDKLEISSTYVEAQGLNFDVKAYVQADSKVMELDLNISLSRSFVQQTKITVDLLAQLKDPLVISLDSKMPSLSSKSFSFDIDSDGEVDQISQLNSGSAFLALDKNNNNIIDNGSELFGTKSGDGFADLSKYDDDKNGWIDENDKIFNKLRIWSKTQDKDELLALGEVGIGAIFLGNTQTSFSLKSESNQLLGEMRKSGFVLFENAKIGVMSQIDLALHLDTKAELSIVDNLKKELIRVELPKLYSMDKTNEETSDDSQMGKLRNRLSVLEAKLLKANEHEKASIQAQIGMVYAQMMDLLSSALK